MFEDDDPLLYSPLDSRFRAAHRALRALTPPDSSAEEGDRYLPVIIEELQDLVDRARDTAAENLGPSFGWEGPEPHGDRWAPVILQLDFDGYSFEDPTSVLRIRDWENSALALAARAYRRECHWDHSPGEAGIWLLSVMPYKSIGASWAGTLTGFAVLHDRNRDGEYETLAHLWTAREWRRRGIGARLVREAQTRFPLYDAEGPVTEDGLRLLEVCALQLLR